MPDLTISASNTTEIIPGTGDTRQPTNYLYHGDNLKVMAHLLPEFEGRIDLIYADPPFDVGTDFTMKLLPGGDSADRDRGIEILAYPDRWGKEPDSYDTIMRERLALMHRLLSDRGALWLHCDYRTNHRFRSMLDDIFGRPMVNEIIWAYGAGGNPQHSFPRKHDYLLVYAKSGKIHLNKDEPIMRVPYDQSTLSTHYRAVDDSGRSFRAQIKNGKEYRTYADQGKLVTDVWTDIGGQLATSPISKETTGYASQKPEKLLERIIAGTTEPDWLVADFFCGSGTTGVVASKLGRRWLMADSGRPAIHASRLRLLKLALAEQPTAPVEIRTIDSDEPTTDQLVITFETPVTKFGIRRTNESVTVSLLKYDLTPLRVPDKMRDSIARLLDDDHRNLVDCWAICLDPDEDAPFRYDFAALRNRHDRLLDYAIALPVSKIADLDIIRIRIVSIFGDAVTILQPLG